ncbi:hypothetical protein [Streptomyces chattanoogensis]|uniref:hypothetical protein n=1 Tax=Streptomyces chattanoogensis TaxID=66876 RepID=UPI0036996374
MTTDPTPEGKQLALGQLLHAASLTTAADLDKLLDTEPFHIGGPVTGPERHARNDDRIRALVRYAGGALSLHRNPGKMLTLYEWMAQVDPAACLGLAAHVAMCVGPICELGTPDDDLSELLTELDQVHRYGSIVITEIGAGNSHINPQTLARYDHSTRSFTLTTPRAEAAKFFISLLGLPQRAHAGCVAARLEVNGRDCGAFLFAMRLAEVFGPSKGVTIHQLPECVVLPQDYAVCHFDKATVPYSGWLAGGATINEDGVFHDPLSTDERLRTTMEGTRRMSSLGTVALAAAARATIVLAHTYWQGRVTNARVAPDGPVLGYSTQRRAFHAALVDTLAATVLSRRARDVVTGSQTEHPDHSRTVTWAPWSGVHRELALNKAWACDLANRVLTSLRPRLGAQAMLSVNLLPEYEGLTQALESATGDKLFILLDAATALITDHAPPSRSNGSGRDPRELAALRATLLLRDLRAADTAASDLDALNPLLPTMVEAAYAHVRWNTQLLFDRAVIEADKHCDDASAAALRAAKKLYELKETLTDLGWHLENGTITKEQAAEIRADHADADEALTDHVPALIAAMATPVARLRAPIAHTDYSQRLAGWPLIP